MDLKEGVLVEKVNQNVMNTGMASEAVSQDIQGRNVDRGMRSEVLQYL